MDGTLTEPLLDFPRIKADMGIGDRPILEALAEMDAPTRATAEEMLHRHEEEAAGRSTMNGGCAELLDWLGEIRLPAALITRNSRASVRTVLQRHGLRIDVLITREDALPKPDPAPLVLACQKLGVDLREAWMVGDGVFDVQAGNAAGIRTVWISHGRGRPFSAVPTHEVADLREFWRWLRSLAATPSQSVFAAPTVSSR